MNIRGLIACAMGILTGGLLILPLSFMGRFLPDKIKNHELFPATIGIIAGVFGMYLYVNSIAGNDWYRCSPLPFCNP